MKSGFYMTTSNHQLSVCTEKKFQSTSQAKPFPKKRVMVTVWWSAAGLIHYSFLNPGETFHLRSMLSKSMRCTKNWNTCNWPWSMEKAQFSSTATPGYTPNNQCLQSWTVWTMMFCLICHIYLSSNQPITTSSSILTTFCRENVSTTNRR